MISSGNEAVLTAADYIHALAFDREVKVICLYIEGVRDGDKFIAAVKAARSAGKPVVVLKGGLTAASARAAAAHTGAFAGEGRVWSAVAEECGVITVKSLEQLLDVALYLSSIDLATVPKGNGLATLSFGGGSGVLSADQCSAHGLVMAQLSDATDAALKPLVPPIASIANPIDLTPQAFNQDQWFATFGKALDVIAADPSVDIVFCQFGPMARRGVDVAREISDLRQRTAKTVCIAWPLAPAGVEETLRAAGIHVFQEYERAIAALGKIVGLRSIDKAEIVSPAPNSAVDWHAAIPAAAAGTVISEHEAHRILSRMGLAAAPGRLVSSRSDAIAVARDVGLPVAMKGISPSVTHRAEAGLLALDLRTPDDVAAAFHRLSARAAESGIALDGVYVQAMVEGGVEVIVSAFRDPIFGVMVSCGAGGGLTEIIDDVVLARAPLSIAGASSLLRRLRIVRSAAKIDASARLESLAGYLAHFSEVASAAPWRQFVIEINPVKWRGEGVTAVDGLIIIEEP
jgi:acyl-CoA synthetase (NDP forming)